MIETGLDGGRGIKSTFGVVMKYFPSSFMDPTRPSKLLRAGGSTSDIPNTRQLVKSLTYSRITRMFNEQRVVEYIVGSQHNEKLEIYQLLSIQLKAQKNCNDRQ